VAWSPTKAREQILGPNGLTPFDTGDCLEQFALFLSSGLEGLFVSVRDDRDLGPLG